MEATAIQVNANEIDTSKAASKQTNDSAKTSYDNGSFFSILKNLTSAHEREKFTQDFEAKLKTKNTKADKKAVKPVSKKNTKKMPDPIEIKVDVDEEILPEKFLMQTPDTENPILKYMPAHAGNTQNEQTATNEKTLLQTLLQATHSGTIDEKKLKEFVEAAERFNPKNAKKSAKMHTASFTVKKPGEKPAAKENGAEEKSFSDHISKKFSVKDLRTVKKTAEPEQTPEGVGTHSTNGERVEIESSAKQPAEITISLNSAETANEANAKASSENASKSETPQTSFSQALSEQIYRATDDIVQAGKIVLRDNNEGTIRLSLQPANLGKVKIFLELHEGKKLSGKITVQSKEALSAFEENLSGLIESFEQNGFETSGFDISWSNGNGENAERFMNEQKLFGFSRNYEDDLSVMPREDSAESIISYGQVNVLA